MGFQVSTCPGCACGCGILLEEENGILTAAYPISSHPVSKGSLCIRGWNSIDSWRHPDRLTHPLLRRDQVLSSVPAEAALDRICSRLKEAPRGSVCFAVAPSLANEDILAVKRLAQILGAQVCGADFSGAATARLAARRVLGRHYCSSSIGVLEHAQLIWVFGADLENYPQVASRLTEAEGNGAQVVSFDTFLEDEKKGRTQVFVPPEEFGLLPLLLQKCALESGRILPGVKSRPDFSQLTAFYQNWSIPGGRNLKEEKIREMVSAFAACSDSAVVIGDRWLTTGDTILEQTTQLIQAIALLGAEDRVVIAAGEVNSWGLCDLLPTSEENSARLAALLNGEASGVSVLVTCGDDLLRSAPCPARLKEALSAIGSVIVLDRFKNDLLPFAEVVLPSAGFGEVDGTVTNTFGTVQRWRQIVAGPGEAQPERVWLGRIAARLGMESWPDRPQEWWMTEQAVHSPYEPSGLAPLYQADDSAGWLFREESHLTLLEPSPPVSDAAQETVVQAIFTRHPANWMTGAWSGRDEILRRESTEQVLSVAPADLEERGIKSGGRARLVTHEGAAVVLAKGDSRLPRGLVLLAEVPGRMEISRPLLAGPREGLSFQPVPCRLEKA